MNIINITNKLNWTKPLIPLDLNKVIYIVIHHPESTTATPEQIHEWHLANGWSGFGYNEYIKKDGTVYIGRGDNIGAQCLNYNSKSYGICCEGDYSKETFMPQVQFDVLVERIKYNKARFPNYVATKKHSELCDTACPGTNFPFNAVMEWVSRSELTVEQAIDKLHQKGIVSSPDYWLANAREGKICNGAYVNTLIRNIGNIL